MCINIFSKFHVFDTYGDKQYISMCANLDKEASTMVACVEMALWKTHMDSNLLGFVDARKLQGSSTKGLIKIVEDD